MKLSIWTRGNGRVAAMMMIEFIDWRGCIFLLVNLGTRSSVPDVCPDSH